MFYVNYHIFIENKYIFRYSATKILHFLKMLMPLVEVEGSTICSVTFQVNRAVFFLLADAVT